MNLKRYTVTWTQDHQQKVIATSESQAILNALLSDKDTCIISYNYKAKEND